MHVPSQALITMATAVIKGGPASAFLMCDVPGERGFNAVECSVIDLTSEVGAEDLNSRICYI